MALVTSAQFLMAEGDERDSRDVLALEAPEGGHRSAPAPAGLVVPICISLLLSASSLHVAAAREQLFSALAAVALV